MQFLTAYNNNFVFWYTFLVYQNNNLLFPSESKAKQEAISFLFSCLEVNKYCLLITLKLTNKMSEKYYSFL